MARYYLGENREGRLGRYDHEIDTVFLLCVFAYCTFAGIVIPGVMGLALIILGLTAIGIVINRRRVIYLVFDYGSELFFK